MTRYAAALARRDDSEELDRLLSDLEEALDDSDDEVDNLVSVSFVENAQGLDGDDETELRGEIRRYTHLARPLSHYE